MTSDDLSAAVVDPRSDPETLGHLDGRLLLSGFARAAAQACREGLPVRRLPDSASLYQLTGRLSTAAASAHARRELLETRLADLDERIKRARAIVLSTSDLEKITDYSAEEDRLRAHRRAVAAQLERVLDTDEAAPLVGPFRTYNEVVATALSNLAAGPKKVTQAQYEALRTVMPQLSLHRDDHGIWYASATLRLGTTDETVVEVGPIRWRVGAAGRGTTAIADRSFTFNEREPRAVLATRLTEAGTLTRNALHALLNALFPELPYVVLHGMSGHPFPDWVGPEWRRPAFVAWVTARYTDPGFRWATLGRYTTFSPERQLLAHLCAQHDHVDPALLRHHCPSPLDFRRLAATMKARGAIPDWEPAVRYEPVHAAPGDMSPTGNGPRSSRARRAATTRSGPGGRAPHAYTGIRCECGNIARVVARVPEVPRSLLCECGRMPDAQRHGMPDEVRFPAEYTRVLMLSMERCQVLIEDKLIRSPQTPSTVLVAMMRHVQDIEAGLSVRELSEVTGLSQKQVRPVMYRLAARGFVTKPPPGGRWSVVNVEGLRAYATHVLTDTRTPIDGAHFRRRPDGSQETPQ